MAVLRKLFHKRSRKSQPNVAQGAEQNLDSALKKLKRIEIVSNRIANEVFSGQYKSAIHGQGIEFAEVREYAEGDDVRSIDWNVTARAGKPFVKQYSEERERTVFFLLDVSASNLFGSRRSRLELAAEIVASLLFSAIKNNDKVGLLAFANGPCEYYPPRKGRNYAMRLTRAILTAQPRYERSNLNAALEYIDRTLKRRAVVFIISDFYVDALDRSLIRCQQRHDVIALSIAEPVERNFLKLGFVSLCDPETGRTVELDTSSARVRAAIAERLENKRKAIEARLREARVDTVWIDSDADYARVLRDFFHLRARR